MAGSTVTLTGQASAAAGAPHAGAAGGVHFAFVPCAGLPRLAWCAHLRRGRDVVRVYHGPWVETRDGWFVEGAWTGPFEQGGIDRALFNLGSGGVVRGAHAVFCTQTDVIDRLYSLRAGDDLFVSNSLVFALAMAGDELDPRYPFYDHQLREYFSRGIGGREKTIHTRGRRQVVLHEHCQLTVGSDLRIVRVEKPAFPRPADFDGYVSLLQSVIGAVLENAAAPGRRHRRYEGLAMVSGGYDSSAVAVVLARTGVREAMTFYDKHPGDDSGEHIARHLGMTVSVYGRADFRTHSATNEAEFLAWPEKVSDIVMAPCEQQLAGKVLVTGHHGDTVFGDPPAECYESFRRRRGDAAVAGRRMIEFRLRVGFLNFSPLHVAGLHLSAIRGITMSPEMDPWRLGGDYDRPIPRRIVEGAGIPRGTFAVAKGRTAFFRFRSSADMSPAGRDDFLAYRRSMPRPTPPRRLWHRSLVRLRAASEAVVRPLKSAWPGAGAALDALIPWRYRKHDRMDYLGHWGQARIRGRYAEAVAALAREAGRPDAHRSART